MEGTEGVNSQPGNAGNTERDRNVLKRKVIGVYAVITFIITHTLSKSSFIAVIKKGFSTQFEGTM